MKWRTASILVVLLAVAGLAAAVVMAQLGDTQTASGTINACNGGPDTLGDTATATCEFVSGVP